MAYEPELDAAILSLRASLKEAGLFQDGDGERRIAARISKVRETFGSEIVSFCVERFIHAELDFQAPGDRGLGRISEILPRYGAYFRRHLRSMEENELVHVAHLIRNQVLTGYLAVALFGEDEQTSLPEAQNAQSIYGSWVPLIYSGAYGESLLQAVYAAGSHAKAQHETFLSQHAMKGKRFFSSDKSPGILVHYHLAGAALRLVETGRFRAQNT